MNRATAPATQERVRALLDYNPQTGVFSWKRRAVGVAVGDRAGYQLKDGRWMITVDSFCYPAARWAWLHVHGTWPDLDIDHRDYDAANDKLENLRPATTSQNMANRGPTKNNRSGFKGVIKEGMRWRAAIQVRGRSVRIGSFDSSLEAALAYDRAAIEHFGEFARTNAQMELI